MFINSFRKEYLICVYMYLYLSVFWDGGGGVGRRSTCTAARSLIFLAGLASPDLGFMG